MKRTNRMFALVLALLMVLTSLPFAFAEGEPSVACGEHAEWALSAEGVFTVSGTGDMTNYAKDENVPWAKMREQIKSVAVAEGITSIGDRAFYGCLNMESISLPASLKKIGEMSFNGCSSLEELALPDGLTTIGWNAFTGCNHIKEMIFPNSVKTIGPGALAECNAIASVKLPENLTIVEYHLFRMCHSLKEINIPKTVTEIGGAAFYNCVKLTEVTVPSGVTEIGDFAFIGCKKLERVTVYNGKCTLPEDPRVFPDTTILRGYEGSTLEAFAKANERKFESMPNVPEHDHAWGEPAVTKEATCQEAGVLTYTCSVCKETKEETIPITDHNPVPVPAVAANCQKTGLTEGISCSMCGLVFKPQAILPKTGHSWKDTPTPATVSKNGKLVSACTVCGAAKKTTIPKIKTIKISKTEFVYDGTAKKPTVTVKNADNETLKEGTDYTLKYSKGRKNIGTYAVTVTFKGNYGGTKTLKFKVLPGRVTNLKATALSGRKFSLSWNKVDGAKKYAVYYATSKNGSYTKLGSFSKNTLTTTGYTAGKTYYFKVRAVKTVDGTNYFGADSLIKHAKAKR